MAEYIEFEAAKQAIDRIRSVYHRARNFNAVSAIDNVFGEIVDEVPAADVAPVIHGGWIPLLESEISGWNPEFAGKDPIGGYMCSVCKEEAIYDCNDEFVLSKFCPYCGAKMDKN